MILHEFHVIGQRNVKLKIININCHLSFSCDENKLKSILYSIYIGL